MITSGAALITAFGVYLLLLGTVYFWYRNRSGSGDRGPLREKSHHSASPTELEASRQRRFASGIHRTQTRNWAFLVLLVLIPALTLASLVIAFISRQYAIP